MSKRSLVYQREGSGNWYITGIRRSTGTADKEQAEALARKIKQDQWLEDRMGIKPPRTWKEAVVKWLDEKQAKLSLQDDIERLAWLDRHFGLVSDINRITREQVDSAMQMREGVQLSLRTSANATANKYVQLIAGILNAAERQWQWGNRAPRLRYYPMLTGSGRALTVEEWHRLAKELPTHLRLAATFAVSTGLRAAKVFGLKWSMLTGCESLTFAGTANKIGNSIPMNSTARRVLLECRSLPVVSPEYVFLYAGKPVKGCGKEVWRGALERAGIERIRWHDLRGTFISWLAQSGVPREIRKRLAGHSTGGESHDRYVHLDVEHLRKYACVIDTLLTQSSGQLQDNALSKVG